MSTRTFAITADDKPVVLDSKGAGEVSITVSNTSTHPIRGQAHLVPLGTTRDEWLRVSGEVERNFSANEAHQFVVRMTTPSGTPAGKYPFRLNVVSVQNPDDDFAEGPTVAFELRAVSSPPPNGKKFPWFWVILAVVLIGGGTALTLILKGGGKTTVPVLVDLSLPQVTNELKKANLTLGSVAWTNAGTSLPEHVVSQSPAAETKMEAKSSVSVVVREKPAPVLVPVPRVIGQDSVNAVNALVRAGLSVTNLSTQATPRSNEWNIVLSQSPAPNQRVMAGTPVALTVGVKKVIKILIPPRMLEVNPNLFKAEINTIIKKRTAPDKTIRHKNP